MLFYISISTIFLIQIKIFKSLKPKIKSMPKLYVYEDFDIIAEFNLTISKYSHKKFDHYYFTRGKLFHLDTFLNINMLEPYYHSYNKNWIFLIDSSNEIMKFIEDIDLIQSMYSKSAIIIPTSMKFNFTYTNPKAPLFEVEDIIFNTLKTYDIKSEQANYFFMINYGRHKLQAPIPYSRKMSFASIIISIAVLILWRVRYNKISSDNRFLIAKNVAIFPVLKIIISILMYVKINQLDKKGSLINSKKTHCHFILLTLSLVFKTLLWFFTVFISEGWEITYSIIDKKQLRFFFQKYITIYFTLCIDEAIDNIIHLKNSYVSSILFN